MTTSTLLRSLRYRSFTLLWLGQTISRLGDSLYSVALAWWVLEQTGSALAMGAVLVCTYAPMVLFTLVGGVLADRLPRLQVMVFSDMLSGLVVTIVALLAMSGNLALWHVYVASTLFGFFSAFFEPAYQAAIPDITPRDALASANSLTSLSRQLIGIGGPALAAALVAVGGTSIAFTLNAFSFFLSAALVAPLPAAPSAQPTGRGMLGGLAEGMRAVLGQPWLWVTIGLFSLVNLTALAPVSVALPFLVREQFGDRVGLLGLLLSASAAGAVAMALWLGQARALRRRGPLAYGAILVAGLALAAMGLRMGAAGLALALFTQGAMLSIFGLIWTRTLQELVPRELLGRVVSIDMLGSFLLLPLGFALVGWLVDRVGASNVFLLGGASTAALMIVGLLHPAVRRLD